mgnify:CR=1 FL=1
MISKGLAKDKGARFLLEAAQQMKLKGARGALSAALDVPAELLVELVHEDDGAAGRAQGRREAL